MIKVNEDDVFLKGDKSTILTEFSMLVRTLRKTETISAEDIEFNFQSAFIDDTEEIKELAIQRLMKKMGGLFGKNEEIRKTIENTNRSIVQKQKKQSKNNNKSEN